MSPIVAIPPWAEVRRRLPRLVAGLVLCGVSFACIVDARLGLDPWDVLHEGIAHHTGLAIGLISTLLGVLLLVAWIPLRERIGVGTALNAVIIGTVMDLVLPHLPDSDATVTRWALLVLGLVLVGPAVGLYLGARLGPGPRDGIMTGVARRGPSIRLARTGIEVAALAAGWLLGGTVGIGTVLFAVTVGPNAQFWLERLDLGHPPGFDPACDPEPEARDRPGHLRPPHRGAELRRWPGDRSQVEEADELARRQVRGGRLVDDGRVARGGSPGPSCSPAGPSRRAGAS